jgi:hypothetical protein
VLVKHRSASQQQKKCFLDSFFWLLSTHLRGEDQERGLDEFGDGSSRTACFYYSQASTSIPLSSLLSHQFGSEILLSAMEQNPVS